MHCLIVSYTEKVICDFFNVIMFIEGNQKITFFFCREILLMFFNKETKDIYWKDELDELARTNNRYFMRCNSQIPRSHVVCHGLFFQIQSVY